MTKNLVYSATKRGVEEGIRLYGGNLEWSIPATLYLMSPMTRNFTIRQIGTVAAETIKFKGRLAQGTLANILKGGKPIGWTKASGTGYLGRSKQFLKKANPVVLAASVVAEVAAVQVAVAPEVAGPVYQTHMSRQPSVGSGGSKIIFGSW